MIVFLDTETTSLRPDRRVWEVGLIARYPDGFVKSFQWFVNTNDLDLGNADPMSLHVGRFYSRHPQVESGKSSILVRSERSVLFEVERITRGAHLVGSVPNFDADILDRRMRTHGICPSWHYHLIDVEAMMVGYLALKGVRLTPPWKSDELSRLIGVDPPSDEDRHTALGDADWAMRIYDKVMGRRANGAPE